MRYTLGTVALLLSTALVTGASASEIYKWTDGQGSVHYTDKPDHPSSERIFIASRPTDNARIQQLAQARHDRQIASAEAEAAAPRGPTQDELRAAASERSEKCTVYQERLIRFEQSRHLYREDDNGERVYLDDVEKQIAHDQVRQQIDENCHS